MTILAKNIWKRLEAHPWLTMTLAVFAQTWFTLGNRALWFSDEVRYGNAYQNLVLNGKWMVLSLNGQPYPDKPPVYFWFLWLLDTITPAHMPEVFMLGAALSGLFFLYAAYFLARSLQCDKAVSLASVLILLSTFMLVALFHYSRMDLMFGTFILLSHACLFRAFNGEKQGWWPVHAFALMGIATLIKGPLGFIFPLLTSGVFLAWKGELKKFLTSRMALGLLLMLAMLAAWVGGVIMTEGSDFLMKTVLGKQIIQRATKTFHHREAFYYYIIAFPLAWMPWTLSLFVAPVKRLFSPGHWASLWSTRRQAGPTAFLWIMFASTFIFLSSLSGKVLIYILPMFPPLAIIIANAMQTMDEARTRKLWTLIGGLWIVAGTGLLLAGDLIPLPVPVRGMGIAAALLILGGGTMLFLRTSGYRTSLITLTLAVIIWIYPVGLLVAPSLDNAMSPKRQALIIKEYVDKGYTPFAGRVYPGIFTYYAGVEYRETDKYPELTDMMAKEDKVVLAIRERHWKDLKSRLPEFKLVDQQSIAGIVHNILIKD
ncbi:ArnT family glycosyltransferase [Pseudodesulfovibrio sediminis]|uniref:Glycosyltransferase RgtA/B/C/D-like domain-containing protein n=1 Tax=Pseudodesulfovibrio sediminis TaxID=2810563 RepID=A0ABN6EY85_9BACT|nr:glycosyltransferase family 39 protein [Pseudodesulfovibrio sediminis]BCS90126.1 hypothetical protein PSDVSF_33680 [Pseudodesulfovibrio sediminis]